MLEAHIAWLDMDRRLKVSLLAGALLVGGGAWYGLDRNAPARLEVAQLPAQHSNLESCLYSARIIFDVHWAAACTAEAEQGVPGADGHAECDLAGDRAAAVNAWLDSAEARCRAEAP